MNYTRILYLTKGLGKYKILSLVRVKLLPLEAFKVIKNTSPCGLRPRFSQCGNFVNCLSLNFGRNFVKVAVLLNKLLNSWFDETFLGESKFFIFPHCAFPQSHSIVSHINSLVKTLVSRNFCQKSVRVNFCNYHTVQSQLVWKLWNFTLTLFWKKFRESNC